MFLSAIVSQVKFYHNLFPPITSTRCGSGYGLARPISWYLPHSVNFAFLLSLVSSLIIHFQQMMEQKVADLNKKVDSLTKPKVDGDVEQALKNVRKAVARAPESFDPHLVL